MMPSIKVVIVGTYNVGKTSILTRLEGQIPHTFSESTIGCSFVRVTTDKLSFNVWDTAGQERYMSIIPMYYRNADLVIFTFDVSDLSTIDRMGDFIHLFYTTTPMNLSTKFLFVGNKIDTDHPSHQTIIEKIQSNPYVIRYNLSETEIIFVSARDNTNISNLLQKMVEILSLSTIVDKDNLSIKIKEPTKSITSCWNSNCI
jgi:small GTP-binding protein